MNVYIIYLNIDSKYFITDNITSDKEPKLAQSHLRCLWNIVLLLMSEIMKTTAHLLSDFNHSSHETDIIMHERLKELQGKKNALFLLMICSLDTNEKRFSTNKSTKCFLI